MKSGQSGSSFLLALTLEAQDIREVKLARKRCEEVEGRGAGKGLRRWVVVSLAPSGGGMKHQVHSVAPLTIIKMPGLKGDIPNLRLFVSIKRATQERRRPYTTNTLRRDVCVRGQGRCWVNGNSIHFIKLTASTTHTHTHSHSTWDFQFHRPDLLDSIYLHSQSPGGARMSRGVICQLPLGGGMEGWIEEGWGEFTFMG